MLYGVRQMVGPASVPTYPTRQRDPVEKFGAVGEVPSREDDRTVAALFNREEPPRWRAGFGEGTVSVPTAAARTLDKGLTAARRVVPSAEEVREQQRQERQREAAQTVARRLEYRQVERRRIEAANQSREYINRLNEVATTAQARLAGEEPPSSTDRRATIEIGGTTYDFRSQTNGFNLNVYA